MIYQKLLKSVSDYGWGIPPLSALRAVIELHKPEAGLCTACSFSVVDIGYPCPTTLAIIKELNI